MVFIGLPVKSKGKNRAARDASAVFTSHLQL